jgi:AcrR family transcriptional regulator
MKINDRRYRKTEATIRNSLVSLLGEKDFSTIHIEDLTQMADINRSTFYLHYRSIDDVLGALEDEFVTGFSGLPSFHGSFSFSEAFCISLVDWVYGNRKLAKSVLEPFTARFKAKLDNVVLVSFKLVLPSDGKHLSDDRAIRLVSLTDAFFSILRLWSIDNFHYEKTKIVFLLNALSQSAIYSDFIKR